MKKEIWLVMNQLFFKQSKSIIDNWNSTQDQIEFILIKSIKKHQKHLLYSGLILELVSWKITKQINKPEEYVDDVGVVIVTEKQFAEYNCNQFYTNRTNSFTTISIESLKKLLNNPIEKEKLLKAILFGLIRELTHRNKTTTQVDARIENNNFIFLLKGADVGKK